MKPAAAEKKQKLIDSLHFHQFRFDADEELQWIKERLPAASATDYGKSLVDAQNLQKKQQVFLPRVICFVQSFEMIMEMH